LFFVIAPGRKSAAPLSCFVIPTSGERRLGRECEPYNPGTMNTDRENLALPVFMSSGIAAIAAPRNDGKN